MRKRAIHTLEAVVDVLQKRLSVVHSSGMLERIDVWEQFSQHWEI